MNTDMKWYAIAMIAIFTVPMAGFIVHEQLMNQCRIEAIKVNMEADKIAQVCK